MYVVVVDPRFDEQGKQLQDALNNIKPSAVSIPQGALVAVFKKTIFGFRVIYRK